MYEDINQIAGQPYPPYVPPARRPVNGIGVGDSGGGGGIPVFDTSKLLFQSNPQTLGGAQIDSSGPIPPNIFQCKNLSGVPVSILWFNWVFKTGPGADVRNNPPLGEGNSFIPGTYAPVVLADSAWHTLGFGSSNWIDGSYTYSGIATITEVCAITRDPQLLVTPTSYAAFTAKQNLAEAFKWKPNVDIPFNFFYYYGG